MNPALLRTLATRQAYSNSKSPAAKADSYDFLMDNPRAAFLALSLSLDTFVAGLSYGSSKIRLPLICAVTVSLVCSGVLCLSMLAGSLVRPFLSPIAARLICFLLLVCMGTLRILDQAIKSFLCRHDAFPEISCSVPCISSFFSPSTPIPARRMPTPPKAFLSRNPSALPPRCP